MPWNPVDTMTLRQEFVVQALQGTLPVAELCRRFSISRQTGYKWLRRHAQDGAEGLQDRSRRPRHSPAMTGEDMTREVLLLREEHPAWGGRKISRRLLDLGFSEAPSPASVTRILHRHVLISPEASALSLPWQRFEHDMPNALWQMDFKGWFQTLREGRCNPLTVLDDHSRYNIVLQACGPTDTQTVQECLLQAFRQYGLPLRINTDNGAPWGSPSRAGQLSALAVWLIRHGIRISYSQPYHPQTNGKDERFHRTLKAEVLNGRSFATQQDVQRALDSWRRVYNLERPHEALGMATPSTRYQPSPRSLPAVLAEPEYGPTDRVVRVGWNGEVRLDDLRLKVSSALHGLPVGVRFRADEDGVFDLWFAHHKVATIDLRNPSRE